MSPFLFVPHQVHLAHEPSTFLSCGLVSTVVLVSTLMVTASEAGPANSTVPRVTITFSELDLHGEISHDTPAVKTFSRQKPPTGCQVRRGFELLLLELKSKICISPGHTTLTISEPLHLCLSDVRLPRSSLILCHLLPTSFAP